MEKTYRLVAMCDVLGFSILTKELTLSQLYQRYRKVLGKVESSAPRWGNTGFWRKYPGLKRLGLEYAVFSDTILLWSQPLPPVNDSFWRQQFDTGTPDFRQNVANYFHHILSLLHQVGLLLVFGLIDELPFRAGLAFGECIADGNSNVFLGKAIVDAYETEQNQQWMGAACHPSCTDLLQMPPFRRLLDMIENSSNGWFDPLIRYQVPVKKDEKSKIEWAIKWPYHLDELYREEGKSLLIERVERHREESFVIKWQNALDYYLSCSREETKQAIG